MSNEERDEMVLVIMEHPWHRTGEWPTGWCPSCDRRIDAGYNSPCHAEHVADAILASGYRKPRTITTAAERSTLLPETIAMDEQGNAWKRGTGSWVSTGGDTPPLYDDMDLTLTVLHEAVAS